MFGPPPRAWGILGARRPGDGDLAVHPHVRGEYLYASGDIHYRQRSTPTCVGNTRRHQLQLLRRDGPPPRAWGIRWRRRLSRILPPVHPHVRGEYGFRGLVAPGLCRSTPTCVGNTPNERTKENHNAVHPHVRGEYLNFQHAAHMTYGPPPRAWGIPTTGASGRKTTPVHPHVRGEYARQRLAATQPARSTPTCVGNTRDFLRRRYQLIGPPPRAWGIRDQLLPAPLSAHGPPPRAWGIRSFASTNVMPTPVHPHVRGEYSRCPIIRHLRERSTPTCVGNTTAAPQASRPETVHPHVRGEYDRPPEAPRRSRTVHPHVRGEYDHSPDHAQRGPRSTPTCVGNTHAKRRPARGLGGPPPRAWGIRVGHAQRRGQYRSTPTCVGNTPAQSAPPVRLAVHPHVRGEYATAGRGGGRGYGPPPRAWGILAFVTVSRWALSGPPPRAWGIQPCSATNALGRRSTPTCVGNTGPTRGRG